MAETAPPAMPMEGVIEETKSEEQAPGDATVPQTEGPTPTETIYIQNLNEKIRVDSTHWPTFFKDCADF